MAPDTNTTKDTQMQDPAARIAFTDASRSIAAAYAAGASLDAIAARHDDLSVSLASDAQTGPGRAYAAEFADTGRALIADLRQDAAAARGELVPAASSLPDGTPHPEPFLARRGWEVHGGVYQRTAAGRTSPSVVADREAC
jgi:hypothetical protein